MRDPSSQGYRLLDAVKGVHLTQRRTVFRAATAGSVILCLLILSFFFLYDDSSSDWDLPATIDASNIYSRRQIRLCDDYDKKGLPHLLTSEAKFDHLIDDQFTIVIQTYKRPDILNDTLYAIVEGESKMLHTIIVAWNDLETTVPADWTTPGGIKVHYRQSEKNSLNQKLKPDPRIKTKAVLLADDDTYYTQDDMEYAFKVWRETGQNRLVGAWPRAGRQNKGGKWIYSTPHKSYDYNLILTGLAFTHIAFMDYYSSEDRLMVKIRDYVDEHFNCEDIAMNYLTQSLTGCPALWVKGHDGAIKPPKPEDTPRIGHAKGHGARRTACLNDFNKFFGKMPLKTQDGYMIRGEVHAP